MMDAGPSMRLAHIAVLGAGAWGTALALTAARAGRTVMLWEHDPANVASLHEARESRFLPGIHLDDSISIASDLADAARADAILVVVPAQAVRAVASMLQALIRAGTPVIVCAKGIERQSRKFMSEVIAECAPAAVPAILSGPSFAIDIARGMPAAVTLAAHDETLAGALAQALGSRLFRPYQSGDVRGVEIGGAAKNVLAIGAGIVAGRGLGESTAAALLTRGFAELVRFGKAFGAQPETLMGLSGLGDLILTGTSAKSRNFSLGAALGRGARPQDAQAGGGLAEGAFTAAALVEMATEKGVDMPISTAVAAILEERISIEDAIEALMTRPFRAER
jgi:glycerol-3-phosphate dehydrogenase (NAD(P)+)